MRQGADLLVVVAAAFLPTDAWACSVCVGWTEGQGLNGGFYWSALLLTLLPFAVVAVLGAWVSYSAWRGRPGYGGAGSHRNALRASQREAESYDGRL